jgi:polyisoprenoid-binding protein YceI
MALQKFEFDLSHSNLTFTARHLMFTKVRGQFDVWGGSLELDLDDLTKSKVSAEIDAKSIDTREEKRDAHLRSADFFDVEKHPKLTFTSKRIEKKGEHYLLTGDLTIRGTTREITLDTEFHGSQTDPWGGSRVGFTATGKVQRTDYGLNWNVALEAGGVLVGETVEITLEIQAKKA